MDLTIGEIAPDFSLPDGNGAIINLSDFRGQYVVLYFYPRDNTPGCTKEACGFRDHYKTYQSNSIVVMGISTDDAKSHTKFSTRYHLPFSLLSDAEGKVAAQYESYGLKKFMGNEYMGITRRTFIIDPAGKIAKIYPKVKPILHAQEVLEDLLALMGT